MTELDARTLNDGSGTIVTLFATDDGRTIVEAVNTNGISSRECPPAEAIDWFMHPFCNEDRLDYPTAASKRLPTRELTADEYALAEALTEVES